MTQLDPIFYRFILDSLPSGLYAVDRTGKVIFWNEGAEHATGHLRQDVLGHRCDGEFLEHADSENNLLLGDAIPAMAAMRGGQAKHSGISLRAKNGHFVIVKLHTTPLRDERGSIQGAVEIFESEEGGCLKYLAMLVPRTNGTSISNFGNNIITRLNCQIHLCSSSDWTIFTIIRWWRVLWKRRKNGCTAVQEITMAQEKEGLSWCWLSDQSFKLGRAGRYDQSGTESPVTHVSCGRTHNHSQNPQPP